MRRPFRLPPRSSRRWKVIRVVEEGTLSFVVARRKRTEYVEREMTEALGCSGMWRKIERDRT
jgi:hypothetical protein